MHRTGRLPSKLSIEQKIGDVADILPSDSSNTKVTSRTASGGGIGVVLSPSSHITMHTPSFLGRMPDIDSGSGSGSGSGSENSGSSSGRSSSGSNKTPGLTLPPRPGLTRFHSSPVVSTLSPTRHHFRLPNQTPREIKETLNANYREDESGRSINQYTVKDVIGSGSFGLVRLAIDENTKTRYAIKEYSKQRLKKLNRSEMMLLRRKGMRGRPPPAVLPSDQSIDPSNPINLIRREVAIMKKLDHLNIVNLFEVLDDPHGDLLYVILEYCEKGVIMPVNIEEHPSGHYSEEQCRLYFRDMILGVEYLHSQGIIHRDIKAENVLVSEDDVVKIVDFGVSEIFEKGNDVIKKTAGSPAYMAPELIYLNGIGEPQQSSKIVSGRSADIWSMGVLLYYMRFGHLPFQADTVTDLYYEILNNEPKFDEYENCDRDLKDLLLKILEKDPIKRIKMYEMREHPWVTCQGQDLLLSTEENTADCITPVTEEDLLTAVELIEGVMDADQASAKLRKLHGWRGSLNGSGISRESSRSPVSMVSDSSEGGGIHSMFKLTRALNEILSKDREGGGSTSGGLYSSVLLSRSNGTSPLLEPYHMASSPTSVELSPGNVPTEEYFTHKGPLPEIKVSSDSIDSFAAPVEIKKANGVCEHSHESTHPNQTEKENIDSNEVQEKLEENGPQLQRRHSRSRTRQFLGLEMTTLRSRSLDTDDRL